MIVRGALTCLCMLAFCALLATPGRAEGPARAELGENKFLDLLSPILANATGVRAIKFPRLLYADDVDPTVATLGKLPQGVMLSEETKDTIIKTLANQKSYLTGVKKSTRFFADYALIFEGTDQPNVLLISTIYRGAELVFDKPIPGSEAYANLDPVFPQVEKLLKQFPR